MGNKIQKIQKEEEEETQSQWGDLPQDIQALILGKLPDAVDIIRFRAVCKNWRQFNIPKDAVTKRGNRPWLCNLSWASKNRLECEIHDLHSRKIFLTSKYVKSHRYTINYSKRRIICLGSNKGWLIACYSSRRLVKWKWKIFMYNPYSKEYISLPSLKYFPCLATFSGNRVFILSYIRDVHGFENYIASYDIDGMKKWRIESVGATQVECRGMQCVNGHLFCLFKDGVMRRYSSGGGSWTSLVLGEGSRRLGLYNRRFWLAKGEGDILVACEFDHNIGWSTFCFDWSSMSWIGSELRVSSAIFRIIDQTCFLRTIVVYGFKVYLLNEVVGEEVPEDYFFAASNNILSVHDFATEFIEPPSFN